MTLDQFLNTYKGELSGALPWVVGLAILALVITYFAKFRANANVRRAGDVSTTLDYEKMRRAGLLSDEELKRVRQKMVGHIGKQLDRLGEERTRGPRAEDVLRELDMRVEAEGVAALAEGEVSATGRRVIAGEIDMTAPPPAPIERERLTPEEEERLARLAREQGLLDPAWEHRARMARERAAHDKLVARAAPTPKAEPEVRSAPAAMPSKPSTSYTSHASSASPAPRASAPEAAAPAAAEDDDDFALGDPLAAPAASARPDIDAMLRDGVITQAEYDKLRAYYSLKRL